MWFDRNSSRNMGCAAKDGFERLKGRFAVRLGVLFTGVGENASVPETFRLHKPEPIPIPHREEGEGLDSMPAKKLVQAARCAWASRKDRLMLQMPPNVFGQAIGRLVPVGTVFFERLHHNPVQVPTNSLPEQVGGGAPRFAMSANVSPRVLSFVDGLAGSCSRMTRCISI